MPTLTREPENAPVDRVVDDDAPRPKKQRSTTTPPKQPARRESRPRTQITKEELPGIRLALAEQRERRWRKRCARLDADTALDPRLRAIYKLRMICDTQLAARVLGISAQRVSYLRMQPLPPGFDDSLPGFFPTPDTIVAVRWKVPDYGTELGRLLEAGEWEGRFVFDYDLGTLEFDKEAGIRHGRPPLNG